jgi:uncharacterized membrane protein
MNKMLVTIFETEPAAEAGLKALHALHAAGDITLYASAVVIKNADGKVHVTHNHEQGLSGPGVATGVGLAVGSLVGLIAGPIGMAVGAATGTLAGAVRDLGVAGVGLDFVEDASMHLQPGKVALVAEIEEEWVSPIDTALALAGGRVFRRTRADATEHEYDHDIHAFKSEIKALQAEVGHAGTAAIAKLETQLIDTRTRLDGVLRRAKDQVDTLKQEADGKADSLQAQLLDATGDVKGRIEARMKRVKGSYHARGSKLSQAWDLTKQALSV